VPIWYADAPYPNTCRALLRHLRATAAPLPTLMFALLVLLAPFVAAFLRLEAPEGVLQVLALALLIEALGCACRHADMGCRGTVLGANFEGLVPIISSGLILSLLSVVLMVRRPRILLGSSGAEFVAGMQSLVAERLPYMARDA
jgi:hypothetical protein